MRDVTSNHLRNWQTYLRVSRARCEQRAMPASEIPPATPVDDYLYIENHWLGQWFKKAYGDKDDKKTPFAILKVRSANCTKNIKGRTFRWD